MSHPGNKEIEAEVRRWVELLQSETQKDRLMAAAQLGRIGVRTRGTPSKTRGSISTSATARMPQKHLKVALKALQDADPDILLNSLGKEEKPGDYFRVGMSYPQLKDVAKRGGAVLVAGVQTRRFGPVLAALQGRLVSVLVTDLSFARKVLNEFANAKGASRNRRARKR